MIQVPENEFALQARGVGRVYGDGELASRVLHPTDLSIRTGEITAIMGPSGSGKTTLLSILGLVLSPSEGVVRLGDDEVTGLDQDALSLLRRKRIGFVFQQFNLISALSALENVALPLLLDGVPADERRTRALAALALTGLADRAEAKPRSLSGGQQQRVAIARALVTEPRVILCDEPTASLDGHTGREIMEVLKRLAASGGRAIVIVTHDDRVLPFADRVVELVDGRVREERLVRQAKELA